jgi:glycosyltransferase involved in cell wall biosynthesis
MLSSAKEHAREDSSMDDVKTTVLIPSIPSRADLLDRAIASVDAQTCKAAVHVQLDETGQGAARTRNVGLRAIQTPYVAFLDDDDWLYPDHVELLQGGLESNPDCDLAYSWFDSNDPNFSTRDICMYWPPTGEWRSIEGMPFTSMHAEYIVCVGNMIPVCTLARLRSVQQVGGFPDVYQEDWRLWQKMLRAGQKFYHVPKRTWYYNRHPGNTAGLPYQQQHGGTHVRTTPTG